VRGGVGGGGGMAGISMFDRYIGLCIYNSGMFNNAFRRFLYSLLFNILSSAFTFMFSRAYHLNIARMSTVLATLYLPYFISILKKIQAYTICQISL
jgi:hypothetical protein